MSSLKTYTPSDFITMPWRNGLGSTIELAKHQTDDSFMWRLSMADVAQDGAFSDFSGYDRCLILVSGLGMTLSNQQQQWILNNQLDSAHFRGEDVIDAALHDGPIRDFNIMTRRKDCKAAVFTSQEQKQQTIPLDGDLFLLFNVQGEASFLVDGGNKQELAEQHLIQVVPGQKSSCVCSGDAWVGILITYL